MAVKQTPLRCRCGREQGVPLADGPIRCECGREYAILSDFAGGFLLLAFDWTVKSAPDGEPDVLRRITAADIAAATGAWVIGR